MIRAGKRLRRRRIAVGLLTLGGLGIATGCASSGTNQAVSATPAPLPLATAVRTASGTWATVAMGQLDDPENTYWQLFYRPAGSLDWADDVAATGTATNGGLVLSAGPAGVAVGVLTSQNLTFSPVILTSTQGDSWQDGLLPSGLSAAPQALASSTGKLTALLGRRGGTQQVVTDQGPNLTAWQTAVSLPVVAAAEPACDPGDLAAAAYVGSELVLGSGCQSPGPAGLVEVDNVEVDNAATESAGVRAIGPDLGAPSARATAVSLSAVGDRLAVLFELRDGAEVSLDYAVGGLGSGAAGPKNWTVSRGPRLAPGQSVASIVADQGRFIVVLGGGGAATTVYETATDGTWRKIPPPPAGTATVAPLASGGLSALSVSGATLTSWDLAPGATAWTKQQTLNVPILYGSSS